MLEPVFCPPFLHSFELLRTHDLKPVKTEKHGAYTDVRFGAWSNLAALRAFERGRVDLPIGPNPLQHGI